ncbi:MAG: nicotinate (nicotinamide) nucleotide adenylyltransferase [Pseudomonadota bacterium]
MEQPLPAPPTVAVPPHALGLFGGRFDPVHRAHVAMAQAAADQLGLEEVRWLVTGQPVHKVASASADHRLAMTRLVLEALQDPRMVLDDREVVAARQGKESASFVTVASFQAEYPGRPLVWILGEDQLASFTQWRQWQWLAQSLSLAVCRRPGATGTSAEQALIAAGAKLYPIVLPPDAVSSTDIRQRVHDGRPLGETVSPAVARYIHDHQIYLHLLGGPP